MQHARRITRAPKRAQGEQLDPIQQIIAALTKGQSVKILP